MTMAITQSHMHCPSMGASDGQSDSYSSRSILFRETIINPPDSKSRP
uniref:Uncharacterized protein n=1 Tax=Arundo donax TaxID=35708 RepID=A0A0A9BJQ1_ARUDO